MLRGLLDRIMPASKGRYTEVDKAAAPNTAADLVDQKHYDFEGAKTKIDVLWGKYSSEKNQTNLKAIKKAVTEFGEQLKTAQTKKSIGTLSSTSTEAQIDKANETSLQELSRYFSNQNLLLTSANEDFTAARDAKMGCCSYLTYCLPAHLFIPDALPKGATLDDHDLELDRQTTDSTTVLPVAQPVHPAAGMRVINRPDPYNTTAATYAAVPTTSAAAATTTENGDAGLGMFDGDNSDSEVPTLVLLPTDSAATNVTAPKPQRPTATGLLFAGTNAETTNATNQAITERVHLAAGIPTDDDRLDDTDETGLVSGVSGSSTNAASAADDSSKGVNRFSVGL